MKSFELDADLAKARLLSDLDNHGSLIVAVDFDNTLVDFHSQGLTFDRAVDCIKRCIDADFQMFVFTANNDHDYVTSVWRELFGRDSVEINKSPLDNHFESRKPYYSILLDDRAGLDSALGQLEFVLDEMERKNA